jgi:YHS domain-containing protein
MVEDPVCGMEVNLETAPAKTEYEGQIYYFCSESCKEAFEEDPEQYLFPDEEEAS